MRFPRQAKIFRGQLDAAPVAGVVFLLLMFLVLSSLSYTPGVLVELTNPAAAIRIAKDGRLYFGPNSYTESETNLLRAALRNSAVGPPFALQTNSGVPPKVSAHARDVVNSIFAIQPPAGPAGLLGTDNPTVTVRVNFLGQYFYDNRIVGERELKAEFTKRMRAAAPRELTLTVVGDEQVTWNAITRLERWAREAGIKETVQAEWLDKPDASPAKQAP